RDRRGCIIYADGALLNLRSQPSAGSERFTNIGPCARVPGRFAEPCDVKNPLAHPWSWAIGSPTKRGPGAVRHGRLPSESLAFRVDHEIRASGKRPTIPDGNGDVDRVLIDGLRSDGQRVFSERRTHCDGAKKPRRCKRVKRAAFGCAADVGL